MKKTYTRRLDRFVARYRADMQISYELAEQRLLREFQRRVDLRARQAAATSPAPPNGQEQMLDRGHQEAALALPEPGTFAYALAESQA